MSFLRNILQKMRRFSVSVALLSLLSLLFFWRFLLGFPLFTEVGTHQTFDWQAESSNNSWCGWAHFVWIIAEVKTSQTWSKLLLVGRSQQYEQSAHAKSLIFLKKKNAATLASGVINIFERDILARQSTEYIGTSQRGKFVLDEPWREIGFR